MAQATPTAPPPFHRVFAENLDYVWRILRHLRVPDGDVEDVAQEVFLVVHRRLPQWEPRADIRTWLYAIAWRTARDHRSRAWNRRVSGDLSPHQPATTSSPADVASSRQALARVEQVLRGIDDDQRMVFLLYEVEGLPMDEIATAMECPVKTAYSRLRLAREQVRRALAGGGAHDG